MTIYLEFIVKLDFEFHQVTNKNNKRNYKVIQKKRKRVLAACWKEMLLNCFWQFKLNCETHIKPLIVRYNPDAYKRSTISKLFCCE
jgi:hypothetical protein